LATSGTQRPGGRTERTRQAVLHATLDLLAERGFGDLTVDAVAERSGVHKTTVYRRWSSPDGLVAAALQMGAEDDWTAPDTGSLEDDLYEVAAEVVRYFTEPALKELPMASVAAAFQSSQAAEALHDFYADRHVRMAPITERAVARGEVPPGTDGDELVRAVCGPMFYRLLLSRETATVADARVTARAVAAGAAAGSFVLKPHSED